MAETTTGSLSAAMPEIIADARIVYEYDGTWQRTCDVKKQTPNTGLSWTEFALSQMQKQDITETTDNRNFQAYSGTLLSSEPQMSQIVIKVTDRTYRKIASVVSGKFGTLAGNAMKRGKDEDYLSLFSTFSTAASPLTGNPLSFGHITAAVSRIGSNVTEPNTSPIYSILHGYQIKDIQDEILAGVGTYPIQNGMTEQMFRTGFKGSVANSEVYEDGNITVDSIPDARGATHAKTGVVCCLGMAIKHEEDRDMYFGGGADVISLTDEYSFVERSTVWAYQHLSDATAPTS